MHRIADMLTMIPGGALTQFTGAKAMLSLTGYAIGGLIMLLPLAARGGHLAVCAIIALAGAMNGPFLPAHYQVKGAWAPHDTSRAWAILFGATGFELVSTYYMHLAKGFSVPGPAALAVIFYAASFYAFNLSLRGLELSVAYAVWSAVVMAALSAIGMGFLGERVSRGKVSGIAAIILGTCLLSAELAE